MKISQQRFGPWALVTGASSGIGKAFAHQLAGAGLHLILVARRAALSKQLGEELRSAFNIQYRVIEADLSEQKSVEELGSSVADLDVGLVVSNAGSTSMGEFLDMDAASLHRELRLNTTAHLSLAHQFGRRLLRRGRGGLLLVSSTAGYQGVPYVANYAATKAYILSLGEALHHELGRLGVTVTVLLPGPTDTPMMADAGFDSSTMPMKPMSAEQAAREGLAALEAGLATRVPGRLNRVLGALLPRRAASSFLGSMIAKGIKKRNELASGSA
jgi:short-subunit dehydrogenase